MRGRGGCMLCSATMGGGESGNQGKSNGVGRDKGVSGQLITLHLTGNHENCDQPGVGG